MVKSLKFAVVAAIFLVPFTQARSALSWTALSYEEAAWLCSNGYLQACDVMYAYETARPGMPGGSPADRWVSPEELRRGGVNGVRRGPLSTYDFVR